MNEKTGAVLVCGGGIAGIQSALDLAESGFKVYLVDSSTSIGGRMAQIDRTFPAGDYDMSILSPKLVECARNRNIEIITLADILSISGEPGSFKAKIRQNPRYVDTKKCDACGYCAEVCPVSLPNEFDGSLGTRKAAFRPHPQSIPGVFSITKADGTPPCRAACPAGVNAQGIAALAARGKFTEAYDLMRKRCPLPGVSGRVCRHPCQTRCHRNELDAAVSISGLERYVADYVESMPERHPTLVPAMNPVSGRVAVIGSGPAGLTAAADLALMGYRVTLFEAKPQLGGMLRYGIPAFRLPKDILEREIRILLGLGIEVWTNTSITRPKDLLGSPASNGDSAPGGGFSAVFMATGAWFSRRLDIPGEDARGVFRGLDFLCEVNSGSPAKIGPGVLVLGGTDLALDAARCALRVPGVESVQLACLESRADLGAHSDQLAEALDEGVAVRYGLGPTRIESADGRVTSVIFRACTSVFDRHKRRFDPIFDDASISAISADTVIVAVGRGIDSLRYGLETRPGGRVVADPETLATSVKGIFAGGDLVLGPASVVDGMAQGHRAADSIDAYIRGSAFIRSTDAMRLSSNASPASNQMKIAPNPRPECPRQQRTPMPRAGIDARLQNMAEINLGYGREQAVQEAKRCLACGLCSECMQCTKVCAAGAILHDQQATDIDVEVGSVVLATSVELNPFGFAQTNRLTPLASSRPGVYLTGAFREPKDIPEAVAQGSAAAACAMRQLTAVRGTMTQRREYPWERDVADEAPRIGVFVCHCGHNVSSVVDVEQVARKAARLPHVCHAEASVYTCSESNQRHIKEIIRARRLNRLVVASCSSRTHEVLFQETLRESGLNQFLLAMTNIRDQCAWVHRDDPAAATAKAVDLVSMAVARARFMKALPLKELPVTPSALIIGGGLAGMTAAQNLAEQGFKVHLVERTPVLGGMARNVRVTLDQADVHAYLAQLINTTRSHPRIKVHLNSELIRISGQAGDFTSVLNVEGTETPVEHGVVIVATGGQERPTEQFFHGHNPDVITQSMLESMLSGSTLPPALSGKPEPTVAMIQCVESRDAKNPYCSRICCSEAVKNALEIKRRLPHSRVLILGRDMQACGFRELYYRKAVAQGVQFIRHPEDGLDVVEDGGRLKVNVRDMSAGCDTTFLADLLVVSTGIAPASGNPALAGILRSALTADGFFQEAHPKLRPVDLANEGEFLCGVAHSPGFMDETIVQAHAAAARASTILSKAQLEIAGHMAWVSPTECVACATCIRVCPYGAPRINDLGKAEVRGAMCMGCGSCAAACPSRAITLQQQEREPFVAMLDELLVGGGSR